ncbi:NAD-dependent epimerase/dehydratase family protein [Pseudactinotalea sp.]|uniref:NAD-dependent epimerase/dehydratase family protein n=1 Tax=Pseudactinotalea sp. TaxID=1926260 RepID=UPI003B3AEAF1
MDVLLLGGTGWLGGEVARAALAHGHEVTALARGTAAVPDGVSLVRADRAEGGAYEGVLGRDWDLVLDVAWQPGLVRSAVAALGDRAARWVYVSSGSVYRATENPVGDETDPLHDPLEADQAGPEEYAAAKVTCEQVVSTALGERAVIARAGLIGGSGDGSDRFGYYPAAFARAGGEAVLLPDLGDAIVQTISVADLAAWLVTVGGDPNQHGIYDAYGEPVAFTDLTALARSAAGHSGAVVTAAPDWLLARGVGYFMGPRSLPFWLPPGHELTVTRASQRAREAGLSRRPYRRLIDEALADERSLGFDRDRRAGLTRAEETELLASLEA